MLNLRLRDHVTPALKQLHWLPVASRIKFEVCLLVHLIHTGRAPLYLIDCVQPVTIRCSRRLRSSETTDYVKRTTRTKFRQRGFSYSGPAAWNDLLPKLRTINLKHGCVSNNVPLQLFFKTVIIIIFFCFTSRLKWREYISQRCCTGLHIQLQTDSPWQSSVTVLLFSIHTLLLCVVTWISAVTFEVDCISTWALLFPDHCQKLIESRWQCQWLIANCLPSFFKMRHLWHEVEDVEWR